MKRFIQIATTVLLMTSGAWPAFAQSATRTVFVAHNVSDSVVSYTIDNDDTLTFADEITTSDGPIEMVMSPSGRWLAVPHATQASVEVLQIIQVFPDATLALAGETEIPDAPLAAAWLTDEHVAVCSSSFGGTNLVNVYHFDPEGDITLIDTQDTGGFNTYLALTPDRRWLFANDSGQNVVRRFLVNADGTLTFDDETSTGGVFPLDLWVTHDGTKLYAACGISGDGHRVLGFDITDDELGPQPLPGSPFFSPGESPAHVVSTTDDAHLIVGHGTDATARSFTINADGSITPTGVTFDVGLQGTLGDMRILDDLLFITDESTALDGVKGLYVFRVEPDGTFMQLGPIIDTGGTRPEKIAVWKPTGLPGDLNCDGLRDSFDIEPFIAALFDPDGYAQRYPDCDRTLGDMNRDGAVDGFDIEPFIDCLFGGNCP